MTKINSVLSTKSELKLGVPQGSVLGPLLFSIFKNDLPLVLKKSAVTLFANDTTMLVNGADNEQARSLMKKEILELNEWCKHNCLYINWSKTFLMVYSNKRLKSFEYVETDTIRIQVGSKFKLLGVYFDNKFQFIDHVHQY
jgi:hypothetical protein